MLRHGEPQGGEILRGHRDDPLSETGWQQMEQALSVQAIPWDRVISSPLTRCASFASLYSERHQLPLDLEPDLKELNFGLWEGRSVKELYHSSQKQLTAFWQDPHSNPPPQGENYKEFQQRVLSCYERLTQKYCGQHLLLICHAGTIRTLIADTLQIPYPAILNLHMPYAALSRINLQHEQGNRFSQLIFHAGSL